jgi:hypothetical protein
MRTNQITAEISGIILEMEWNGVTLSKEQSKILERDHGVKIAPHFIAEYKYCEKKKAWRL